MYEHFKKLIFQIQEILCSMMFIEEIYVYIFIKKYNF